MAEDRGEERRRALLEKKRQEDLASLQKQKDEIISQTTVRIGNDRFMTQNDNVETALKAATVGLVRLEDFQRIKSGLEEKAARERELGSEGGKKVDTKKRKEREKGKVKLSFGDEEEEEGAGENGEGETEAPKSAKSNGNENGETNGHERDGAREGSAEANGDSDGEHCITVVYLEFLLLGIFETWETWRRQRWKPCLVKVKVPTSFCTAVRTESSFASLEGKSLS